MKIKNKLKISAVSAAALIAVSLSGNAQIFGGSNLNLEGTGQIIGAPPVDAATPGFNWGTDSFLQGYILPISHFTGLDSSGAPMSFGNLIPIKTPGILVMVGTGFANEATAAPLGAVTVINAAGISTVDDVKVVDGTGAALVTISGGDITTTGDLEADTLSVPSTLTLGSSSLSVDGSGNLQFNGAFVAAPGP